MIKFFLVAIIKFLSYFIEKSNYILFANGNGSFSDNSKYLFLYMLDKKLDIFYIVEKKSEYVKLKDQYPVLYKWDIKTFVLVLRANVIVYTHGQTDIYPAVPSSALSVNLWHGTPIKKIGLDSTFDRKWIKRKQRLGIKLYYESIDLLTAGSEKSVEYFKSSMSLAKDKILVSGLARNDYLFKYKGDKKFISILKKEILNSEKKVILYAPTFRDEFSETTEKSLLDLLLFLEKEYSKEYLIVLKLHPKEIEKVTFNFDKFKCTINLSNSNNDIQEIMLITDVLITDYSSLIYDYTILERPIILYAYDLEEYQNKRGGFYINYKKEFQGYAICENIEAINDSFKELDQYINMDYCKTWNKNNACETIYKEIMRLK